MNVETWIGLFALLVAILSLFVSLYYNRKDHERRKKQATIEFFEDMTSKLYNVQAQFNIKFNQLQVEIDMLDTDPELLKAATEVPAAFERLCVGVNAKIFDFDILDRMAGSYLMVLYARFSPYIEKIRRDASRTNSYKEFESVVNRIKQKRNSISRDGQM